jgi:hypothetical protein
LIDFSDFSSEIKNSNNTVISPKKEDKGNNIKVDIWNW